MDATLTPTHTASLSPPASQPKKKRPRGKDSKESSSSSDEERWLEKIKDPKLMTARQRAMYEREHNAERDCFVAPELLVCLPTGYKEKDKVLTAEAIERAQAKSAKRKELADQKREKERQRTMDRLLKKQESKLCKVGKARQARPGGVPIITYKSTRDQCVVIFPADYDLRLDKQATHQVDLGHHEKKLCCICASPKRYNCSRTNRPLCSLQCYRQNAKRLL